MQLVCRSVCLLLGWAISWPAVQAASLPVGSSLRWVIGWPVGCLVALNQFGWPVGWSEQRLSGPSPGKPPVDQLLPASCMLSSNLPTH